MDLFSRRQFVTGLAAGGVVAGMGVRPLKASAFSLEIGELPVNFTGRTRLATVVNGSLPAPLLRFREGDEVILTVANRLKSLSAIHWHGLLLPSAMDGVPGLSFPGIAPGESYDYRFKARQSRYLLVSRPCGLPGTDRPLRADHHRSARAGTLHVRP